MRPGVCVQEADSTAMKVYNKMFGVGSANAGLGLVTVSV